MLLLSFMVSLMVLTGIGYITNKLRVGTAPSTISILLLIEFGGITGTIAGVIVISVLRSIDRKYDEVTDATDNVYLY